MLIQFTAAILASGVAYLPHLVLGDVVSPVTDFMLSSFVGGVAFVFAIYKLKKLRGDF